MKTYQVRNKNDHTWTCEGAYDGIELWVCTTCEAVEERPCPHSNKNFVYIGHQTVPVHTVCEDCGKDITDE